MVLIRKVQPISVNMVLNSLCKFIAWNQQRTDTVLPKFSIYSTLNATTSLTIYSDLLTEIERQSCYGFYTDLNDN